MHSLTKHGQAIESHSTAFPRKNTIHPKENGTQDECRQILVVDTEKQKYYRPLFLGLPNILIDKMDL